MKADFASIYTAPDPRPYYSELAPLDYQVPDHGGRLFSRLVEARRALAPRGGPDRVTVVDLCCSYGVNATVMKHHRPFTETVAHYTSADLADLDSDEVAEIDRRRYATSASRVPWLEVVGIDSSAPAVEYAERVGLLDRGLALDLEEGAPSEAELASLDEAVGRAGLITCTGGIGYIGERTVGRVLDAAPADVWMATLCLRWIDMGPVVAELERRGLVVERLDGHTFRQRRFADEVERAFAISETERLGLPAAPDDGYHHTDLYLARPAGAVAASIDDLVGPTRG